MAQIDINKPRKESLVNEIMKFLQELDDMIDTSSKIQTRSRIKFDPFLFMTWRIWKNANNN